MKNFRRHPEKPHEFGQRTRHDQAGFPASTLKARECCKGLASALRGAAVRAVNDFCQIFVFLSIFF
jgi:hypothetical protein